MGLFTSSKVTHVKPPSEYEQENTFDHNKSKDTFYEVWKKEVKLWIFYVKDDSLTEAKLKLFFELANYHKVKSKSFTPQ